MVVAQGQGEKGPCDPALFLSAPLALLMCVGGTSGGSGDSLPSSLCT